MSGNAIPTEGDILQAFLADLDDAAVFLRTERTNALGAFDTHSWGDIAKLAIAAAIRQRLYLTRAHPNSCPCTDCT